MQKDQVDKIITVYQSKIYGFALSKTMNIDKAEEVASRITFEVYTSLLKAKKIHNINSYIFRISSNVYSRFVIEEKSGSFIAIDDIHQMESDSNKLENYARIRKEIGYLSNLHREIVVMYYYEKLKIDVIAKKLNTYTGKVKWHLFEARKQLKDGFLETKKTNSIKNILNHNENHEPLFLQMLQFGYPSPINIDTAFYFRNDLTQQVALSAYLEPKSSIEIAKELEVSVVFVEDELEKLVENGFCSKETGNKFMSNLYISITDEEKECLIDKAYSKYVETIYNLYIKKLFVIIKKIFFKTDVIYSPEKDYNFLMWTIVTYAMKHKLSVVDNKKDLFKLTVRRQDGSNYIAGAIIANGVKNKSRYYKDYGDMYSGDQNDPIRIWEFFSKFDDDKREAYFGVGLVLHTLHDYLSGKLIKDNSNIDKFISLYEKGYIYSDAMSNEYLNIVVTNMRREEFDEMLPDMSDDLKMISNELDDLIYYINKPYYPSHKQNLCRIKCQNSLTSGQMRVRVLEFLLKNRILKPLKKHQKKTMNMIIFKPIG